MESEGWETIVPGRRTILRVEERGWKKGGGRKWVEERGLKKEGGRKRGWKDEGRGVGGRGEE